MGDFDNPFAAPQATRRRDDEFDDDGLWRKGKQLVMRKSAQLPARCVKSNEPTERRLKRSLYYHHPLIYALIFFNLLVYAVVALVVRHSAKIHIGLSDEWLGKRLMAISLGWFGALGGIAMMFVGFGLAGEAAIWTVVAGFVVLMGAVLYGSIASRMVNAARIDKDHIWLKGVCPEYLEDLPEWPFDP